MGGITEKNCTRCHVVKPVAAFQPDRHKVSGYASACRACKNAARRKGCGVANAWTDAEAALVLTQYAALGIGPRIRYAAALAPRRVLARPAR